MDDPGDCQTFIADSTSSSSVSERPRSQETQIIGSSEAQVSSTVQSNVASSSSAEVGEGKPLSPPSAAGKGKIQQAQQHHQFRAPQQYVKHKKSSSTLFKKNKTWNKRQNKNVKLTNPAGLPIVPGLHMVGSLGVNTVGPGTLVAGVSSHSNNSTKADLENIQNLRNQPGGYHYYHRSSGAVERGGSLVDGMTPYKKMLMHNRSHHHHILCSGAAHNNHGGSLPINCCHINGCSSHNTKDNVSHNGSLGSVSNGSVTCCIRSKFFLPDKRPRKEVIIPPTKFLLGGNISDPLNLNSLQNETSNTSTNNTPATTPRRSPITTPPKVEVIIPPNIHDPLHLLDPVDTMEYEKQLTSPMKRGCKIAAGFRHHKHRNRKNRKPKRRRNDSYNSTATSASFVTNPELEESASTLANSSMSTNDSTTAMLSLSNNEKTNTSSVNVLQENEAFALKESEEQNEKELVERNMKTIQPSTQLQTAKPKATHTSKENLALKELYDETAHQPSTTLATEKKSLGLVDGAEGIAAVPAPTTVVSNVAVVDIASRERISRDLRLELSSTTSSTCGSVSAAGGGIGISVGGTVASASGPLCNTFGLGVGGRKRKISESNLSQKSKKHGRFDTMDKIVSPVVPQPGAWKRPPRLAASGARKPATRRSCSVSENEALSPIDESTKSINDESGREETPDLSKVETISESGLGSPLSTISATTSLAAGENDSAVETPTVETTKATIETKAKATPRANRMPQFPINGAKYRYGNYDRYAGCRNLTEFMDVRLQVFQRNLELFENKDILDIGCNSGYMSISVARNFAPKSVLGIDIDEKLIATARRNLALFVRLPDNDKKLVKKEEKAEATEEQKQDSMEGTKKTKKSRRKRSKRKNNRNLEQQMPLVQHLHPLLHHHHLHQHFNIMKLKQLQVDTKDLFPISFPLTYGPIPRVSNSLQSSSNLSTKNTPSHPCGPSTDNTNTSSTCEAGAAANTTPASSTKTASYPIVKLSPTKNEFPNNVFFRQTNYVLKDEALISNEAQQYDVIICLSVTKWIHLNFGDAGLKLAFKRMFNQLRPGGKLILEAQNWASYKNKKNLTEDIYLNYRQIEFFPNKFHEYLLSSEVGFSHSYTLGVPRHLNKGFCRPIQLYAKGDYTPNHVRWSDAYYPQTPYEAYRGIYATMPPRPEICQMSSTRSQAYDTPHYTGGTSGPYSCRQTPMHQPTSQYYNPLETDSYQPSYDMEYLNHMYVFASPLYQTVWSPPASMRRTSSTHTPIYGSVRDAEIDGDGFAGVSSGGSHHRHVYPPNDDTMSPNANAGNAFNSIRDPDTDDSNQPSSSHVYATTCGESSSSPHVNHNYSEAIEGLLDDEQNLNNEI